MQSPDTPDSGFFTQLALQRVIRRLDADVEATRKLRGRDRAGPTPADRRYLDRLVRKPWGSEFRVYEDEFREVWCLHIAPRQRTSLHCHPNKLTAVLCLCGNGALRTCTGVQYALDPGVVLKIEPGAYHRLTASKSGVRLVEVETPKDKLDLLRIEDDFRDVVEPYEGEDHAPLGLLDGGAETAPVALQPFTAQQLGASRWARLRAHASIGGHRFAVEDGARVRTSIDLAFAIAIEQRLQMPPEITVLGPGCASAADPRFHYLTIRRHGAGSCDAR
ncbi:MAG: cupin domain-containing protein [Solirubrobacteraceae bacterium]